MPRPASLIGAAALSLVLLPAPGARAEDGFNQQNHAARGAYDAHDWPSLRKACEAMLALRPGQPVARYSLAAALAHLGDKDGALRELLSLTAAGLVYPLATDEDFASLRGDARFTSALRQIELSRKPVSRAKVLFTLPEPDLVAEDVAYDAQTKTYFVSSVRRRKIVALAQGRKPRDFVPAGQGGAWSFFALHVDARRRALYATMAAVPEGAGGAGAERGRSALLRYDLATGKLQQRWDLPAGAVHVLGDLTVSEGGDVYVSDGAAGAVYVVRGGSGALEPLVAPGVLVSPQTPALAPGGAQLVVPDYTRGLAVVDLHGAAMRWLDPGAAVLTGVDGLLFAGRDLIAVQNGVQPARILRLRLDAALTRVESAEVLESGLALDPTHAVLVGSGLVFIAQSGWDKLGEDGAPRAGQQLEAPRLLRLDL